MSTPRVLAIMGSGELAPTMAKVHAALLERFGSTLVPGVILDTPYGFQENADDITLRMLEFFRDRMGRPFSIASYRSRDVDAATAATAVARIREAGYVMAGPGSPSYALRQWAGGPIPPALGSTLATGGIVTMASAAALTLGTVTIPVYEIYKVGEEPRWLEGLDLLGAAAGLRAAVVPHFDNAEGGNHDTRFCYLGERRLRMLERALPGGTFILGVDGHTALVLDLAAGSANVRGLGGVTIRAAGRSHVLPAGTVTTIEELGAIAERLAAGQPATTEPAATEPAAEADPRVPGVLDRDLRPGGPLADDVARLEGAFVDALGGGDARRAVEALLELDSAMEARIRAGEDSLDLDNARSIFRSLIARLGEAAAVGVRDPRQVLDPFVNALLEARTRSRAARDWDAADRIRDRLAAAGVEVHDAADGTTWELVTGDGSAGPTGDGDDPPAAT